MIIYFGLCLLVNGHNAYVMIIYRIVAFKSYF